MIALVDYQKGNLKSVERGLIVAGGDVFITSDPAAIAKASAIVLPGVGAFADAAATMRSLGQIDVIRDRVAAGVPFLGICLGMQLLFEEGVEGAPAEDDELSTHNARGLAVLPGVVGAMPKQDALGRFYKVPHVGWNTVQLAGSEKVGDEPKGVGIPQEPEQSFSSQESHGGGVMTQLGDGGGPKGEARSSRSNSPRFAAELAWWTSPHPSAGECHTSCPLFKGIPSGSYFYFTHGYIAPSGSFVVGETTHSVTFPSAVQYGEVAFGVQFHPEKSSDAGAQLLHNFVEIVKGA